LGRCCRRAARGYEHNAALTLGKAVAGLNAQSKGRSLGIFGPPKSEDDGAAHKKSGLGEDIRVELCERAIAAKNTKDGIRAVVKDEPIDPQRVETYLSKKFGEHYSDVRKAMEELADSFPAEALAGNAYPLYVKFRPVIPTGKKGWGVSGELKLSVIASLKCAK
jgi:hypothetical protein